MYVVFGSAKAFSASLDLSSLDGSNGFVLNGLSADDQLHRATGVGDVNADGIDDFVIGTPLADPNGRSEAGISYVVFGRNTRFPASFDLNSLNGSNGFAIIGAEAGDRHGMSVSAAGDVNGDGVDDFIIGSDASPNGRTQAGQSFVVFGRPVPELGSAVLAGMATLLVVICDRR